MTMDLKITPIMSTPEGRKALAEDVLRWLNNSTTSENTREVVRDIICSFCGNSWEGSKERKLIAGPDVYICHKCIGLCNEVLGNEVDDNAIPDFIYYECHVTIEPVFDERLEALKDIVRPFGFQVADLLMLKKQNASPERSKQDTFCTGRDKAYRAIHDRMMSLVEKLTLEGYDVWRYKIESVILDVRLKKPQGK